MYSNLSCNQLNKQENGQSGIRQIGQPYISKMMTLYLKRICRHKFHTNKINKILKLTKILFYTQKLKD